MEANEEDEEEENESHSIRSICGEDSEVIKEPELVKDFEEIESEVQDLNDFDSDRDDF